jgi:hypothetical protein
MAKTTMPAAHCDWAGCARALLAHAMPTAMLDLEHPDCLLIANASRYPLLS